MKNIEFTKLQAAGNDFILLDNRKNRLNMDFTSLAKKICVRKLSVGADGLLILEDSKTRDFKMRIINSDGSEAEMCGNGARCIAYYAYLNKIAGKSMSFETLAGTIKAGVTGKLVKAGLPEPKDLKKDIKLNLGKKSIQATSINTGVPHAVAISSDIGNIDVNNLGKTIRYHAQFAPKGTNVDFVQILDAHTIRVRTYERGVEAETYACGTGSVASAIVASLTGKVKPPVKCITSGGEVLKVYFNLTPLYDINLEGKVELVYLGKLIN